MAKPAYLSVKNYEKFQHYKDRNPPWIKLYNSILDDYAFTSLPEKSRYHYLAILLVASRLGNQIPYETSYLCNMLHVEEADLTPLINAGFLLADRKHKASIKLAPCKQSAMSEESRGETETEEISRDVDSTREVDRGFDEFWEAYPKRNGKRIGKARCLTLFSRLTIEDQAACISAARHYAASQRVREGFCKDPERFLKADFWREWIEPETPQIGMSIAKPKRVTYHSQLMEKMKVLEVDTAHG